MLSVRGLLLFAWLVLIASLFYDPVSELWTHPDAGPFAISSTPVMLQDHVLTSTPYSMGSRLFWTMVVPILPLFLMVFGHEAWRRICPLSLASQIPGYLGIRRRRSAVERRTGQIKRIIPLISRNGWLERNSWYVQFGLLFCGIIARLLLINTDRYALAVALLSVIGAAMLTGVLWGGKTWCNFFCPANVVQKIYTEPRGLLESSPQFSRPSLPQSMCRSPSKKGDVSTCVACKSNCADIDLQRSYWNGVTETPRRNVYYMFFGLIIGFYGFYYLYSGSWDYYFSGIWTHEDGVRSKILQPGLYLFGHTIAIPKLITAPLVLAIACVLALGLGRGLEALYRKVRANDTSMTEQIIVHHCLCVAAWMSINAFYLFGGRPNILLLPSLSGRIVDIVIVSLTTMWLWQALMQSPERYQQEGMAAGLLKQLKKLKLDGAAIPGNKKIENLRPSEIYLLANMLPAFSHKEKLSAYSKMLEEQIAKGTTGSQTSFKLFEDFRMQMNITEEEHSMALDQLGHSEGAMVHTVSLTAEEKATSIAQYRNILESTVSNRIESGETVQQVLEKDSVKSMLAVLRQSLQVSDGEHEAALAALYSGGVVSEEMEGRIDGLVRHKSLCLCLENAELHERFVLPLRDILLDELEVREQALYSAALGLLRNFSTNDELHLFADDLATLAGPSMKLLLRQPVCGDPSLRWHQVFSHDVLELLHRSASGETKRSHVGNSAGQRALTASRNITSNLLEALTLEQPALKAIALTVFNHISPQTAYQTAIKLLRDPDTARDEILQTAASKIVDSQSSSQQQASSGTLIATIETAEGTASMAIEKEFSRIGDAPDNDIHISDPTVSPYHAQLTAREGDIRLRRVGETVVFVDGNQLQNLPVSITASSVVQLGSTNVAAPKISIKVAEAARGPIEDTAIDRLGMLVQNTVLRRLGAQRLARLALEAKSVRYERGDIVEDSGSVPFCILVHSGHVGLPGSAGNGSLAGEQFGLSDFLSFGRGGAKCVSGLEVTSKVAVLVHVPADVDVEACATSLAAPQPT